jgi:ribosome biogenesis protein SSF1/2
MARGRGTARKKQSAKDRDMTKKPLNGQPKSMVIRIGAQEVGKSVSQLVQDVRHCLEPDTAVRLKERRANKLKDFLVMSGPLGVTHLLLFSRSESGNVNVGWLSQYIQRLANHLYSSVLLGLLAAPPYVSSDPAHL